MSPPTFTLDPEIEALYAVALACARIPASAKCLHPSAWPGPTKRDYERYQAACQRVLREREGV